MIRQPVVLGLTLCNYVIVEEQTKKVSLIGAFTGLIVPTFPAQVSPFSVFATLTEGDGDVTMNLAIVRMESNDTIRFLTDRMTFPDPVAEMRYHARVRKLVFPAPGLYLFSLLADSELIAQRRLQVYQRENEHE